MLTLELSKTTSSLFVLMQPQHSPPCLALPTDGLVKLELDHTWYLIRGFICFTWFTNNSASILAVSDTRCRVEWCAGPMCQVCITEPLLRSLPALHFCFPLTQRSPRELSSGRLLLPPHEHTAKCSETWAMQAVKYRAARRRARLFMLHTTPAEQPLTPDSTWVVLPALSHEPWWQNTSKSCVHIGSVVSRHHHEAALGSLPPGLLAHSRVRLVATAHTRDEPAPHWGFHLISTVPLCSWVTNWEKTGDGDKAELSVTTCAGSACRTVPGPAQGQVNACPQQQRPQAALPASLPASLPPTAPPDAGF